MNDTQITLFLKTAGYKSIAEAAEALHLTHQALWKNIVNLEQDLGVRLFERQKHTLTEEGKLYHALFSQNKREYDQMKDEIEQYYNLLNRTLLIGFSEWIDPLGRMERVVDAFRQAHRQIRLSSIKQTNEEIIQALLQGEIDVALISKVFVPENRDLSATAVAVENIGLFVSREGLSAIEHGTIENCFGLPLLVTDLEMGYLKRKFTQGYRIQSMMLKPERILMLPNLQSICSELEFGSCCAVGDNRFGMYTKIPGTRFVPFQTGSQLMCVFCLMNEKTLIQKFIDTVKAVLADT